MAGPQEFYVEEQQRAKSPSWDKSLPPCAIHGLANGCIEKRPTLLPTDTPWYCTKAGVWVGGYEGMPRMAVP